MALTYDEQRGLLSLLREHSEILRAMAKPKAGTRGKVATCRWALTHPRSVERQIIPLRVVSLRATPKVKKEVVV